MNGENIWNKVLDIMKEEISKPSFDTWFTQAQFIKQEESILYIHTENEFQRDWLEGRYGNRINEVVRQLSNDVDLTVSYVCTSNLDNREEVKSQEYIYKEDLLHRIQTLETKVENLERGITDMKHRS